MHAREWIPTHRILHIHQKRGIGVGALLIHILESLERALAHIVIELRVDGRRKSASAREPRYAELWARERDATKHRDVHALVSSEELRAARENRNNSDAEKRTNELNSFVWTFEIENLYL